MSRILVVFGETKPAWNPRFIAWNTVTGLFWDGKGFCEASGMKAKFIGAIELATIRATYENVGASMQDDGVTA